MTIQQQSISYIQILTAALVALCAFVSFSQVTSAAQTSPTLVLTVNGGVGTNVVNGDPVELGWYVDGPLTNCSITEKSTIGERVVVVIDTTTMPSSGTRTVTPPADSNTSYVLNCDALQDTVVVNTNTPTVTMSISPGTDLQTNNVTGIVDSVDVKWSSQNATRCSLMRREKASAPGVFLVETNYWNDYWGEYQGGGTVRYDGDPRWINETNTFYITCYNDNTGAEATASITLNVTDAPPPNPPLVNIWSPDFPSVTRSELFGYAWVDVGFNSANVTSCYQKAYYENGTQYPNPPGWGTSWWNLSGNFTNIQIATTTEFEVTCLRGPVTLGGITYPATSTTKRLKIEVQMPGTTGETLENWDRTTLPPVTVSVTAFPNPIVKNALTGKASTEATVIRQNASVCYRQAYYINGTPSNYTDDIAYSLGGWNTGISGSGSSNFSVSLSTTTRLSVRCVREFDLMYGTAAEIENGTEVDDVVVEVQEAAEAAPPPKLYLYGNASYLHSSLLWNSASQKIGFNALGHNFIENTAQGISTNKITFPFTHPFGASDKYDIWLRVCDESDGISTYNLYSQNGGLVGSFETDINTDPSINWCGVSGAFIDKRIATNVPLNNGDNVTIECLSRNDSERCTVSDIYFGAVGNLVTPQVNPVVTKVEETMLVMAENATYCGGSGELGHWAYPNNAPRYSWWGNRTYTYFNGSNYTKSMLNTPLATSTVFTVTCGRSGDNLTDKKEVNVFVPFSATLSAETIVGSGQCISDATVPDAMGNIPPFGQQMTAPPGYGPNTNGFCSPLIDLAATSPAVSLAGASENNINGTYDNVDVLVVIQNLGPGELPLNSNVAYRANITFLPIYGLPIINSLIGNFNSALSSPVNLNNPTQSPTLTRTFDGVPFGTHTVCSRVNLDGSPNFPESSSDSTNNTRCTSVTLPVPKPPMTLSSDRKIIRTGQSAVISWSVHTSYPLNCSVQGPGGIQDTFNASANYPSPPKSGSAYSNTGTTAPLTSTGEYTLQCNEPITNTIFTEKLKVEMVPDYQEI